MTDLPLDVRSRKIEILVMDLSGAAHRSETESKSIIEMNLIERAPKPPGARLISTKGSVHLRETHLGSWLKIEWTPIKFNSPRDNMEGEQNWTKSHCF
jgi:hypothetical protein